MFAFVRCDKVLNRGHLGAMQRHARGEDGISKSRRRADAQYRALVWDFQEKRFRGYLAGSRGALNVTDAFDDHLEQNKVEKLYKGAPLCLHLIVGVSDQWVKDGGDLHDPLNTRNQKLLTAARDWAESELGGCFAARMDMDEKGGAVVDVFVAPTYLKKTKRKSSVHISTNKALTRLANKYKQQKSFSALQDSWALYATEHLGTKFDRGESKERTKRENLRPEEYAAMDEERKEISADRKTLDSDKADHLQKVLRLQELAERVETEQAERDREVARREKEAENRIKLLQQEADELEARKSRAEREAVEAEDRAKKSKERSAQLSQKLRDSSQKLTQWQMLSEHSKQWRKDLKKRLKTLCGIPVQRNKGVEFWMDMLLLCFGIKRLEGCFAADVKLANTDRAIARIDQAVVAIQQRHARLIERHAKSIEITAKREEISERYRKAYERERESQTKIKESEIPDLLDMANDANLDLSGMDDEQLTDIASKSLRGIEDENIRRVVRMVRRELKRRGIEPARSRSRRRSHARTESDGSKTPGRSI